MEEHCKKHWLQECVDIVFVARALSQVKTRQVMLMRLMTTYDDHDNDGDVICEYLGLQLIWR